MNAVYIRRANEIVFSKSASREKEEKRKNMVSIKIAVIHHRAI